MLNTEEPYRDRKNELSPAFHQLEESKKDNNLQKAVIKNYLNEDPYFNLLQ
jgi:hypothetical protein